MIFRDKKKHMILLIWSIYNLHAHSFILYLSIFQDKVRKATGMQIDAMQDGYTDDTLFSLSAIKVCF